MCLTIAMLWIRDGVGRVGLVANHATDEQRVVHEGVADELFAVVGEGLEPVNNDGDAGRVLNGDLWRSEDSWSCEKSNKEIEQTLVCTVIDHTSTDHIPTGVKCVAPQRKYHLVMFVPIAIHQQALLATHHCGFFKG